MYLRGIWIYWTRTNLKYREDNYAQTTMPARAGICDGSASWDKSDSARSAGLRRSGRENGRRRGT